MITSTLLLPDSGPDFLRALNLAALYSEQVPVFTLTKPKTAQELASALRAFDAMAVLGQLPQVLSGAMSVEQLGTLASDLGSASRSSEAASPAIVPRTTDMPRTLVGGPAADEESTNAPDERLVTHVLNLTGKDVVTATYPDAQRPDRQAAQLQARARLITSTRRGSPSASGSAITSWRSTCRPPRPLIGS